MVILAAGSSGQSIGGRWAVSSSSLDNGEQLRWILTLTQSGNNLKGNIDDLGFSVDVFGTMQGNHFELFGPGANRPWIAGEVSNKELHGTRWGRAFVGIPATPSDELPKYDYIEPPAIHSVASNGLAKTPPMGWNSWNLFAGKVDDATVRTIAEAMVWSGMRDAGYVYVNIDDTWEGVRDAQGNLQSNHKFPDMKALADYVHSKGLKIGIYSSPGPRTCAGYPASYGHEAQDAKTFAAWGIDYLKYDWCSAGKIYKDDNLRSVYQKMGDALRATGRPIVYSLSLVNAEVSRWGKEVGANLWRTAPDIHDAWDSMISNIETQVPTASFAGPGHWNDPDMLEIGNGHMSDEEYRTHMSLWALSAAPLLAGNDLRVMTPATKAILMNREVIDIDQDPLGWQAIPARRGELETWIKPLADGSVAVGVVNLASNPAHAIVSAADLHLRGPIRTARDLWAHKDVQFTEGQYSKTLQPHATMLLRVKGD